MSIKLPYYLQNFGYGTINGSINNSVTSMTMNNGHNFPLITTDYFKLIIWDTITYPNPADDPNLEIVTANYSGSLNVYTIDRGEENTLAVMHASGSACAMTITAGLVGALIYGNASNCLFQYSGVVDKPTGGGEVINNSLTPTNPTGAYRYLVVTGQNSGGHFDVWTSKFIKIPSISTVTVWTRIWIRTGSGDSASLKVNIGGASNTITGTAGQTTPEWKSFTIDVSGLTDGTTYDVTAGLSDSNNTVNAYCANIMGFGS